MTEYTLYITGMQALPDNDRVINVFWSYTGTDGVNSESITGETTFAQDESGPFTPYEELTEEQVLGWVRGTWTVEQEMAQQAEIETKLAECRLITKPLPWL